MRWTGGCRRLILPFEGKVPVTTGSAFVAPGSTLVGDVRLGRGSSVWYGCVLRGDVNFIEVGEGSNVQDNSVIHARSSELGGGDAQPTVIGRGCTVGHSALLHACELQDWSFVGMQAVVMDYSTVETEAMVAAGALVLAGTTVRTGELWAGRPAKKIRDLSDKERAFIRHSAASYELFADRHRRSLESLEGEKNHVEVVVADEKANPVSSA